MPGSPITPPSLTARCGSPADAVAAGVPADGFVSVDADAWVEGQNPRLNLPAVRRWLALGRRNIYWMGPAFGVDLREVPPETQFLLTEYGDGSFGVVLPLIDGGLRFCLRGTAAGLEIVASGDAPRDPGARLLAVFANRGSSPFTLMESAVAAVAGRLKSFLPRGDKPSPEFLDHFGWCTWNAFYDTVTAEKILRGLEVWRSSGLVPGLLIVDDGWMDRAGDYLNAFAPSPAVFPEGLAAFNTSLREDFGVKMFGIWHAFQGYWGGVNPDGPLGLRFRTVANRGRIRPWEEGSGNETDLLLVHPEDIERFYAQFYGFLRGNGVDFVKVDGQSATEVFTAGVLGRVDVMKAYQTAFQNAGRREFGGELLHCMAHSNDVIWQCRFSNAMRSSDDYRPLLGDAWQQQHLVDNAYNALLIAQVAVPDWDMFQSHHSHSAYHAAARAISGGPIYVSDEPGRQDPELLEKLVWIDRGTMRTLRCPHPAMVTGDRLLTDCRRENRILKIFNTVNGAGLIGLFHVGDTNGPISDTFSPSDVQGLAGGEFVVWLQRTEEFSLADSAEDLSIRLGHMDYEIAVVAPLADGFAMLGLLDKFNVPAGIRKIVRTDRSMAFEVLDGGRVGFYSARRPARIEVNGGQVPFSHTEGLTVVAAPRRRLSSITVFTR